MRTPRLTKDGKLPRITKPLKYNMMSHDIQDLFTERLPNHTLVEVCKYIAGYFYRQQKANEERIEKLEEALNRIADVSERWDDSLIKQINEIARIALAGEKKDA